ncbi:MAG: PepSY domain-containing protein [Methanobacterium sp.]
MAIKSIFKILVIIILIITILNCAYADTGPSIGENQAKAIAQNYLNSHNLPYTAVTPNGNIWYYYVKNTKTGEKEWISINTFIHDDPEFGGPGIYKKVFDNMYGVWLVQVNSMDGKNAGTIYIDGETGKVLKVTVPRKSQTKNLSKTAENTAPKNTTNTTNLTSQTPESNSQSEPSGVNTGIIFGIIALIIAIGAGYFMYTRI